MISRRNFLLSTCSLALLAGVGGCGRSPREPGVIRTAQEPDASTLDPARSYDTSSIPYTRVLYRGLVDYDENANIYNEVARSRTISPDGKTFTFRLRDDVHFHSGRRVVAEDFRYALERVLDPATASDALTLFTMIDGAEEFSKDRALPPEQRKLKHVRGIEVRGDDTIIFKLTRPDVTFLNYLAMPFAYAVPREAVEKWGKSFGEHPDGCGPFKLKEWVHDARLVLEKNPKYFRPEFPRAERVEVQFGHSATLQMMRFEQGQTDTISITDANPPDFVRISRSPQWKNQIQHAPMMDIRYLTLNNEMKPFDNVQVRRAVNHAINRKRIASFLAGRATLANGPLPPGMPGRNEQLTGYEYDPAKAKALIKQAGYEGKFPNLTLWYSTGEPWYGKAAQSIQSDLKQIGVAINIKGIRYADLKAKAGQRKNVEMALMGWLQDFPDPSNFLDVLFHKKSITETASINRTFYSRPEVNQLLDKALVEQDRDQRLQMYKQAEKMIVEDAPMVFLHHTERYIVDQPWVKSHKLHPMWSERLEFIEVP